MTHRIALRQARPQDFAFCERLYFETMGWIIAELDLDIGRQRESFARQWRAPQVRIVTTEEGEVGWLQTCVEADAVMLQQLYVDLRFQRQGIGSDVLRMLIEEAASAKKAIALGVVRINPARSLYERFGFRVTHEDQHKVYMRRELD